MSYWLLKTEPDAYSWDDLQRDRQTTWDGISNALALKHLRTFNKGDHALIYHTGGVRAAIGTATVLSAPYADPKQHDEKLAVVDLKVGTKLKRPVTLDEMKADPIFAGWDLLRLGRLSVVPVPTSLWKRIEELSRTPAP